MNSATNISDDPRLARVRLLSCREVAALLAVSKRTILRMAARGELPPPVYLAPTLPRWRFADIQRHLDGLSRREARPADGAARETAGESVKP